MKMKTLLKLTALAGLLAWALPAHAGGYYDLTMNSSSATLRVGNLGTNRNDAVFTSSGAAVVQSTSATSGYAVLRALNYAGSEILKLTQAGALTVSSFVGNLTGNADTATSLSLGAIGQFLYQSASGVTAYLPAMGAGGIITGNGTSVIPSTGTFTGTASQVTITRTGSNIVLSLPDPINVATSGNAATATALAADGANCSAGQYPLGVSASGAAQNCTAAGVGDAVLNSTQTFSGANKFTSTSTIVFNHFRYEQQQTVNTSAAAHNTSTFTIVVLNTKVFDVEGVTTLSASTVTFPAGTYTCTFGDCFQNTGNAAAVLYDESLGNGTYYGRTVGSSANTATETNILKGAARFTIATARGISVRSISGGVTACAGANYQPYEVYTFLDCFREK